MPVSQQVLNTPAPARRWHGLKKPNCETETMNNQLTRRAVLAAIPATGAVLALPAAANPSQTEILRLFHQHQEIKAAARAHVCTTNDEDEELESLFYRQTDQLENDMLALPSTCAADVAAKMIVAHCDGAFSCLGQDHPVWIEARRITAAPLV